MYVCMIYILILWYFPGDLLKKSCVYFLKIRFFLFYTWKEYRVLKGSKAKNELRSFL